MKPHARPSTGSHRRGPLQQHLIFSIVAILLGGGLGCSCERSADPLAPEQILLDKAIFAMWGEVAPETVTSFKTRSTFLHSDSRFQLETYVRSPDRYREIREAYGIQEIHTVSGDETWVTVDGVLIPIAYEENADLRLQPWLFNVSKLSVLKDPNRFDLEALGELTSAKGGRIHRLRIRPREVSDIEMIFDFQVETHLLERVEMTNRRSNAVLTLNLSDYRKVQGVQIAHNLTSERNNRPYATEIVTDVKINEPEPDSLFVRPAPLPAASATFVDKQSIGGLVAAKRHEGDRDEVSESVEDLKDWIGENKLEIAGPLILTTFERVAESRPEATPLFVCIPVSALPEGEKAKAKEGYDLRKLEQRRALCTTRVDEEPIQRTVEILAREAERGGMRAAGPALEIFFSPDGRTRQVQLPVE